MSNVRPSKRASERRSTPANDRRQRYPRLNTPRSIPQLVPPFLFLPPSFPRPVTTQPGARLESGSGKTFSSHQHRFLCEERHIARLYSHLAVISVGPDGAGWASVSGGIVVLIAIGVRRSILSSVVLWLRHIASRPGDVVVTPTAATCCCSCCLTLTYHPTMPQYQQHTPSSLQTLYFRFYSIFTTSKCHLGLKVKVKSSTCHSVSYMRQTQDQKKRFIIVKVAADWDELMNTAAHYAAIYCPPKRTIGPAVCS